MKKLKEKWWIILIILFLIPIPVIVDWALKNIPSQSDLYKQAVSYYKNEEFDGKVIEKYIDKKSHNYQTIIIWENYAKRRVIFNDAVRGAFDYITVGDSIVKNKDELFVLIIRNSKDTIFEYDFGGYRKVSSGN